jgi:hypothetical protein
MISIDQAKAFDSINHKFMNEVYKFFGIGPNFRNMMATLCNNRTACLIYDDGSYSKNFPLEQGRPQGNGPSPLEYNMGQQILLFKIELDPKIQSVYTHFTVPRPEPAFLGIDPANVGDNPYRSINLRRFRNESRRETDKADGFADDCTITTVMEHSSLNRVKEFLISFGSISGLKCNMDKTFIMQIGRRMPIDNDIINVGFKMVDDLTLLGVKLSNNVDNFLNNFDAVQL